MTFVILVVPHFSRYFVPEHLTRKELKSADHFTTTVETAFDYFGLHRRQVLLVAAGVVAAALLATGIYFWMNHERTIREEKLAEAMQVSEAPIGAPDPVTGLSYPTPQAKEAAEVKAYSDIAAQYSGTNEGAIAEYTLAGMAVEKGRNDEARKRYQKVAEDGKKEYVSLAKLALAQLDFADGKSSDGEKLLRDLMAHPTALVSKDQATMTLARLIGKTRPAEARQMLLPLVAQSGAVGQAANSALSDLTK